MGSKYGNRAVKTLLAVMLLSQPLVMGSIPTLKAEASEIKSGEIIPFSGNEVNKIVEQNGTPGEGVRELVDITDNNLEEGDFKIISGDGSLKYNADGSVTYNVTSTQKNKIVYNQMKSIKNGVFEADITPGNQTMNRFGMIYRVQDPSAYSYVGTGDGNNQYFGEIFGPANTYTGMTTGVALEKGNTYRLRVKIADDLATLFIDDKKVNSWTLAGGVDQAGLLGFEKSRGAGSITISNVRILEEAIPEPPTTAPIIDTLSSDFMDVKIDQVFPRVIEYNADGKVMNGQVNPVYGLKVNGAIYYPEVSFEKKSNSEALYTLKVKNEYEKLDATFKVSLKVDDNQVIYNFEDIKNNSSAIIETIEFADMNFISVNSDQADSKAKLTNLSSDVTKVGDVDVTVDGAMTGAGTSSTYYTALLSNAELSAGVWSSSEVDGYRNLVAKRSEDAEGVKSLGIGSNALYYQRAFMPEAPKVLPTIKIAIAKDSNDDGKVNWQDAAIAYRGIMQDIPDSEDVNNKIGTRIVMNFGSQAQQPFLKTLDNIKKVALATDGLKQPILLKGYGNEGHDSAHPDYGNIGERIGGAEDMNMLVEEGHKYNAEFGTHINAQETYPEAKAFTDAFIHGPGNQGWGWIDQGYVIDKLKDLSTGTRAKRLDDLHTAVPNLDFIYLDVWYQDQWESNRIAEQFFERGWRMTTEFGTSVANNSTFQHWATDKNYGGAASKGINSEVLRFISNHQKDSWVLNWPEVGGTADNPLLGGFELAGFEGWQSDKNFDEYIRMTFDTNMPTKFLQKYYVTNWETVAGDKSKTNLEKEIKLADPSNDDVVTVTRKDGSRGRVITLNDNVVLDDHTYLIPWVEQDFKTPTPNSEKMYHWNRDGGTTTWTLADEYANAETVYVYKMTDKGRTDMQEVKVVDNQITLTAEPSTAYIVVTGKDNGLKIDDWSTGSHVYDTGFNSGTLDDKKTIVAGDKESLSVKRTNQVGKARQISSGDYYLNVENPTKLTTVTRTISNLEPGKDYVAEVYVENQSDVKAAIAITGGVKDVSNYTLRSLQKNYIKADSHATNNGYTSKMQRMQVSFTADTDTAQLTLSREPGAGWSKFDEIRVVQKSLTNRVNSKVFVQDFETVVQGIYPFVIGNTEGVEDNRIHLSELNAPYTQKGWANAKLVDDVISGDWSVKVNTGNIGLTYKTIPQHLRFEAGYKYKVSFDYQTTANSYRFISGDQENDARKISDARGLSNNELLTASADTKRAEFTVTGSDNGQTYIGIFNDGTPVNMHTGAGTFMLDNLRVEKIINVNPDVDLSILERLIVVAEAMTKSGSVYTKESVSALKKEIEVAKEALESIQTKPELMATLTKLQAAIKGLVRR